MLIKSSTLVDGECTFASRNAEQLVASFPQPATPHGMIWDQRLPWTVEPTFPPGMSSDQVQLQVALLPHRCAVAPCGIHCLIQIV